MSETVVKLPEPQERQKLVLICPCDEILFGGAAGAGKSYALLLDNLHHAISAETQGKTSSGVLFRRTFRELDELVREGREMYGDLGWKFLKDKMTWESPHGSILKLSFLASMEDAYGHRGFEYDWCVGKGTPIVMADGTSKPIESIQVGDLVETLWGPSRVTRCPPSRIKKAWRVSVNGKRHVIGEDHQLLTAWGWLSPLALQSKLSHASGSKSGSSAEKMKAFGQPLSSQWPDHLLRASLLPQSHREMKHQASGVCLEDVPNTCEVSCDESQAVERLQELSVPLVLHGPSARQSGKRPSVWPRPHDACHAGVLSEAQGSQFGYPTESRSHDAQLHRVPTSDLGRTPSLADAGSNTGSHCEQDGLEKTQSHAGFGQRIAVPHPYTNKPLGTYEDVLLCQAELAPAGEVEVFDLRVGGASHYLLEGGIVSKNCGFDELTLWSTADEYNYLGSRLRSNQGVKTRRLSTSNPDGPGHGWVKRHFQIDRYPQGMTPLIEKIKLADGRVIEKSRIFIPGRLKDNIYLAADGRYEAELRTRPPHIQKMLLDGRWDVIEGAFFHEWNPDFHVIDPFVIPEDWTRWMAMDWGSVHPYCVLWFAMSPSGEIYIYRELYGDGSNIFPGKSNVGTRETARQVAEKILRLEEMSGEVIRERYADSQIWQNMGHQSTIGDDFIQSGVVFQSASKLNKAHSVNLLRQAMQVTNGMCQLKIFRSCIHLIQQIPAAQVNESDANVYDPRGETHALDAVLYGLRKNTNPELLNERDVVAKINSRRAVAYGARGVQ